MLKYIGNGGFIVGIPARDLTAAEVKEHGEKFLVESGLYEKSPVKKKSPGDSDRISKGDLQESEG